MSDEANYIEKLISQGEHQQLDFKFEISDSKKIAKTLVAFANTDGGRLLIGVKDNGRITGVRSEEEYYMIDAAASMYSKPEISFESYKRMVSGKIILEIIVHPSNQKPYYAMDKNKKWLAYHRVDDENLLATPILLQVWQRERREKGTFIEYSEKEKVLLSYLKSHGPGSIEDFCQELPYKKRIISNMLVNLISLHIIEMIFTEKGVFYQLCDIKDSSIFLPSEKPL